MIERRKPGRPPGTFKNPVRNTTRVWRIWMGMRQRCHNKKSHIWKYYGGRGITVCDKWNNALDGFKNFYRDMGEDNGLSIDRIDNNAGYCRENCRWATMKQQIENRRSTKGVARNADSLRQKCLRAGMPYMLVYLRTRLGWSEDKALTTPKLPKGRQFGTRFPKGMDKENAVVAIVPKKPNVLLQKGWV